MELRTIKQHLNASLANICPRFCIVCQTASPSGPCCPICMPKKIDLALPRCPICSTPEVPCSLCAYLPKVTSTQRYLWNYDAQSRDFIRTMKYKPSKQLISLAAKETAKAWPRLFSNRSFSMVCPMPANPSRLKKRGLHHMLTFTHILQSTCPDLHTSSIHMGLRLKAKSKAQTDLATVRQRIRNIKNSMYLVETASLHDQHVLILDDVFTTGASTTVAATLLKNAGAASVSVFTIAYSATAKRYRQQVVALLLPFSERPDSIGPYERIETFNSI